jgi:hypothetical protein
VVQDGVLVAGMDSVKDGEEAVVGEALRRILRG